MKLPLGEEAVVPEGKLIRYLLNEAHPEGRSKAVFFRRAGFTVENAELLRAALVHLAATADMTETAFAFGRKYVGGGEVVAPSGAGVRLTTVWVIRADGAPPVFVTAYPA